MRKMLALPTESLAFTHFFPTLYQLETQELFLVYVEKTLKSYLILQLIVYYLRVHVCMYLFFFSFFSQQHDLCFGEFLKDDARRSWFPEKCMQKSRKTKNYVPKRISQNLAMESADHHGLQ